MHAVSVREMHHRPSLLIAVAWPLFKLFCSYTVLENRTAVDLELTAMRKENVLRTFRLGTGREDWGIMSTEHYLRVVRAPSRCSRGQTKQRGTTNVLPRPQRNQAAPSADSDDKTHDAIYYKPVLLCFRLVVSWLVSTASCCVCNI